MNGISTTVQDEPEPLLEINTTPLIDVMLVLLIMFIITIPVQLHAVNLQSATAAVAAQDKPKVITIEIQVDNSLWWDGQSVQDREALDRYLVQLQSEQSATHGQPEMRIRAHPRSKYGSVAMVLAAVQRHGFLKINIVS